MAKIVLAQDGTLINFDNIVTVEILDVPNDEETAIEGYMLCGMSVSGSPLDIGFYESEQEAEEHFNALIAWFGQEAHAVYTDLRSDPYA